MRFTFHKKWLNVSLKVLRFIMAFLTYIKKCSNSNDPLLLPDRRNKYHDPSDFNKPCLHIFHVCFGHFLWRLACHLSLVLCVEFSMNTLSSYQLYKACHYMCLILSIYIKLWKKVYNKSFFLFFSKFDKFSSCFVYFCTVLCHNYIFGHLLRILKKKRNKWCSMAL